MDSIKYAPIFMPTLCRYSHFKNSIESLKRNTWAKYTDVYIALDYPAQESHWDGYKKICEYLETDDFSVFKSFNITKREKNFGAAENVKQMRYAIMQRYDCWIYAEDDIVFSPVFLEYMDKCLTMYEDDDNVLAVNGYAYPVNYVSDKDANIIFQSSISTTWGTGYWTKKYIIIEEEISNGYLVKQFDKAYKTGMLNKLIKFKRADYIIGSLGGNKNSLIRRTSDVAMSIYIALKNKYVITPIMSKTRNLGFDGSGLYCPDIKRKSNHDSVSYDYNNQPIDMANSFDPIPDSVVCRKENKKILDEFLFSLPRDKMLSKAMISAYQLFGIKLYKVILKKFAPLIGKKDISFEYLEEYTGE